MQAVRVMLICLLIVIGFCDIIEQGNTNFVQIGTEQTPNYLKIAEFNVTSSSNDDVCKNCEQFVSNTITYRRSGASKESMRAYFLSTCKAATDYGESVCNGIINIHIDTVLYIIDNKSDLTSRRFCAIYFQARGCTDPDAKQWKVPLPPRRSSHALAKSKLPEDEGFLNILHLTDFHYDPSYKAGTDSKCDKPLCCQDGHPEAPENAAGFWGDYNFCDTPPRTFDDLMDQIRKKHLDSLDFVYFTGDIVSHKSWHTSKEANTKVISEMYDLFATTFGNKTVYPILGNHEPHPADLYSPANVTTAPYSTQWIYDLCLRSWSRWLPASTHDTIRKGGYYSVLVKPGFRIIAINSNVCFTSNIWLVYLDEDPLGQLRWLVEELYKAEGNNEKVHLLSHIPPGHELCHRQWSNQFRRIVERFAGTIAAQFNGHTHQDEFRVFYNPDNSSEVINVAYNGASFTTFVGFNSNYRIYQVSSADARVENYDQYIFNLTEANINKSRPDWYKQYSFKEAYHLADLSLPSLGRLLQKLSANNDLLYQYFRFLVRDSDVYINQGCDNACLKKYLCLITAIEADSALKC